MFVNSIFNFILSCRHLFIESPLDLSMPLIQTPSTPVAKTSTLCNHISTKMINDTNLNEDRNSITCSEDSGILSSSSSDDIQAARNVNHIQLPSSPISQLNSPTDPNELGREKSKQDFLKSYTIHKPNVMEYSNSRPNSTSSDISNLSDCESLDVVTRLAIPGSLSTTLDNNVRIALFFSK